VRQRLERWVDGLAFQPEHAEHALVDPPQRLSADEPLEPLDPEREFAMGERPLSSDAALAEPVEMLWEVYSGP